VDGFEVLVQLPAGDVVADVFALYDGVAEVEAEPDPGVDDLLLDVVDGIEELAGREGGASVLPLRVSPARVNRRQEHGAARGGP